MENKVTLHSKKETYPIKVQILYFMQLVLEYSEASVKGICGINSL
jgi:hypothetical protein